MNIKAFSQLSKSSLYVTITKFIEVLDEKKEGPDREK